MDTGRTITKEEWEEMHKLREATLEQLAELATLSGYGCVTIHEDYVRIENRGYTKYDPIRNDEQSHKLLQAVIKGKDCRLFHDDGIDEYFIYECFPHRTNPPVGHRQNFNEVVFEAAMNLYFPEEE